MLHFSDERTIKFLIENGADKQAKGTNMNKKKNDS